MPPFDKTCFVLTKILCRWMDSWKTFQTMKSGIESPAHTVYNLVDVNLRRWVIFIDTDALHRLQSGKQDSKK